MICFTAAISPGIISSGCMDNGSTQVRHSVAQSPSGTFIEPHWSSSVPSNIPSPVAVVSISKQYGLNEHHRNMDNIKFNNQCLPSFHPHSLPDYHDGLVNGIAYTPSSIGSMACNIGSSVTEAGHVGVGSNGHPMELKGGGKFSFLDLLQLFIVFFLVLKRLTLFIPVLCNNFNLPLQNFRNV